MRVSPRLNRHERREVNAQKLKNKMSGTGLYVYENNTDSDLTLPKATDSGVRKVGPRKQFQGDSYFMQWVGSPMNLLKFVQEIVPKTNPKAQIEEKQGELIMNEQKLILDQPDCINKNGKIERVVSDDPTQIQINDNTGIDAKPEVLLTEDPVDGIEIILG